MAGCASIRVAEMEAAGSHSSREGCWRRSSSARRAAAFTFGMLDQLYRAGPGRRRSQSSAAAFDSSGSPPSHPASHDQVDECLLPWCNGRLEKENALKPFKYAGEKASRL